MKLRRCYTCRDWYDAEDGFFENLDTRFQCCNCRRQKLNRVVLPVHKKSRIKKFVHWILKKHDEEELL